MTTRFPDNTIIQGTLFTIGQDENLVHILDKVKQGGCYWPTEDSMRAAHGVVSHWAPELVITRGNGFSLEILLDVYRAGVKEFHGLWHIPGGYNRWPELDVQATCSRIARREIGVDVETVGPPIDVYKWTSEEHVYGHPLSLFYHCRPLGDIKETDTLRFVRVSDEWPGIIIGPHARFIAKHFVQTLGVNVAMGIGNRENFQRSISWKLPEK